MLDRTTRTTVTFLKPFSLRGLDGVRPAGTYAVETDEELIMGMSFDAYRRTNTFLFLPSPAGSITTDIVSVDPVDLQDALARDAVASGGVGRLA